MRNWLLGHVESGAGTRHAIRNDPRLTDTTRRVLRAVYEELVDGGPNGS